MHINKRSTLSADLIVKFIFTTIICIQLGIASHRIITNQMRELHNQEVIINNLKDSCNLIKTKTVVCEGY